MQPIKPLFLVVIFIISGSTINAQKAVLSCPSNIIIKAEPGKEGATVNFPATSLAPELGTPTYMPASGSFFRLGSHGVILTTSTGQKCSFTVTVTDNESPVLSPLNLSRTSLWPASNKMKKLSLNYTAHDNSEDVKIAVTVSSNAADGIKDWEILDNHLLRLKASRLPDGSARIYTITVTASDESGNKTTRKTTIAVSQTIKPVVNN